ncbi:MAG: DUF4203 domain-containing protein [Anaerolineaceae bacterium]|nr:MAG: DUF4203 domain-containing protein [Anaerolineaceae bacterium]
MTLELLCMALIALLFGTLICFGGYRLFLVLLPIWGFFFGFGLGAQTVQLLFGQEFLATVTSWVVGFVVALLFALLSYLFYVVAVAIIAGSLGYGLGVAIMGLFSADLTVITWIVGIALAIVVIFLTFRFNIAKYVIIIGTAVGGAAVTIAFLVVGVGGVRLLDVAPNPIRLITSGHWIWALLFLLMAIGGIVFQIRVNRNWEVETYNRLAEM